MATTDASEAQLCTMCNNGNARRCTQCKSAYYCSEVCQKADWRIHKLLCADFANFDLSTRPSKDHVRAIHFPDSEKNPRIVWAHAKWWDENYENAYQFPECEPFIGGATVSRDESITHSLILNRELPNTVKVGFRDNFLGDGSKLNESIAAILATKPGLYPSFRGGIVAWSMVEPGLYTKTCKDIDMIEFRHVVDYFLAYREEGEPYGFMDRF